jgi:hypothetical protein
MIRGSKIRLVLRLAQVLGLRVFPLVCHFQSCLTCLVYLFLKISDLGGWFNNLEKSFFSARPSSHISSNLPSLLDGSQCKRFGFSISGIPSYLLSYPSDELCAPPNHVLVLWPYSPSRHPFPVSLVILFAIIVSIELSILPFLSAFP